MEKLEDIKLQSSVQDYLYYIYHHSDTNRNISGSIGYKILLKPILIRFQFRLVWIDLGDLNPGSIGLFTSF